MFFNSSYENSILVKLTALRFHKSEILAFSDYSVCLSNYMCAFVSNVTQK